MKKFKLTQCIALFSLASLTSFANSNPNLSINPETTSSYDVVKDLNQSLKDPTILQKSANLNGISESQLKASLHELQAKPEIVQKAYEEFQMNADIIRLQHLKYWVELIEEYQQKTGKYPLQDELSDSQKPLYVEVANPIQQEFIAQHPPAPAVTKRMSEFVMVLEAGLGREIDELYDPQFAPDAKPNFYIYMVDMSDGTPYYNFAVHTHQKFLFGKQVAANYNKVEVSNVYSRGANLILTSGVLFSHEEYKKQARKTLMKPEFFEQRQKKFLHATKGH